MIYQRRFHSRSTNARYTAGIDLTTRIALCTCKGFKYTRHCWHTDLLRDAVKRLAREGSGSVQRTIRAASAARRSRSSR